jgi:hypothetical protein
MNFNQQNPQLYDQFGGFNNFLNQFNNFVQSMQQQAGPQGMAAYAEQQMRDALSSGKISQEQFNAMAQRANQMLGDGMPIKKLY